MKRISFIITIGFLLAISFCCVLSSYYHYIVEIAEQQQYTIEQQQDVIDKLIARIEKLKDSNIRGAIETIERSQSSHQEYIDNPDWCGVYQLGYMELDTGDLEFHASIIEQYQKVLEILYLIDFNEIK